MSAVLLQLYISTEPLDRAAYRGLGHVLAISRGLATFRHPEAPEEDYMSQSSDGNGASNVDSGLRWSGNVGDDLRRDEQCLFDSVGSVSESPGVLGFFSASLTLSLISE